MGLRSGFALIDLVTGSVTEFQPNFEWADICFSHTGDYLFVYGKTRRGGMMSAWKVGSEQPTLIKEMEINKTESAHGIVGVSPDDQQLLIADGFGYITSIAIPQLEVRKRFVAHTLEVTSIAFSPDGKTIVTAGADGVIRFWQRDSWKQVGEFYVDGTFEFVRFISSASKGLGLVVGSRKSPRLRADVRVYWIDTSDDWDWLQPEGQLNS